MQHLAGLNREQQRAAIHTDGPLLILAGAGAGKTKTLTRRIAHLIYSGIAPHNILAITFTNKAAQEMKERVQQVISLPPDEESVSVHTFHAFGVRILRAYAQRFNRTRSFTIVDAQASRSLVKEAITNCHFDPKQLDPRRVQQTISHFKNKDETADSLAGSADSHFHTSVAEVWHEYERLLRDHNGFDFDDLLGYTLRALEIPEIREAYQKRFHYIHIDEYQDTNTVQYRIAKHLAGPRHNICVVGDGDQNIYSWRGANIKNILEFETDFPGTTVVTLTQNYRSTETILSAANAIIGKNTLRKDKELYTQNGTGDHIDLYTGHTETDEATYIAERIIEYVDQGVSHNDIAILYRTNFQSRVLEEAMLSYTIPYQVLGTKFFDRKEIKDVLSYLTAAYDQTNRLAIKRTINYPKRGIGSVSQAKLFAGKQEELPQRVQKKVDAYYALLTDIAAYMKEHPPADVITYILRQSGIEETLRSGTDEDAERLENCHELVTLATKYHDMPYLDGCITLLEDAALRSDQDDLAEKKEGGVKLMTVHAAKGLEFPIVFVTGLEHGLFPQEKDNVSLEEKEEERRLFYVALTRAQEKLILTHAHSRMIFGTRAPALPSVFLNDIPPGLLQYEQEQVHYLDI